MNSPSNLTPDETSLLDLYRQKKEEEFAAGYEEAMKYFLTVLATVIGSEPPLTIDAISRLILQDADRILKDAPALALSQNFKRTVSFYAELYKKRSGKSHNK